MEEAIYYIYAHANKQNGTIFYIGKGKNDRVFSANRRSERWHNYVNKYGYMVTILAKNLTEKEAFQKEVFFIKSYGRKDLGEGNLINMSDGGAGGNNNKGKIFSQEWKDNLKKATIARYDLMREQGLIGKPKKRISKEGQKKEDRVIIKLDPNGNPVTYYRGMKMADWALEARENKPKILCQHCGEPCNDGTYAKYHGENCKFSPDNILKEDYKFKGVNYGQNSKLSKLTDEIALEIVRTYNHPDNVKIKSQIAEELAQKYGLFTHYVKQVGHGSKRKGAYKQYLSELTEEELLKLKENRQIYKKSAK